MKYPSALLAMMVAVLLTACGSPATEPPTFTATVPAPTATRAPATKPPPSPTPLPPTATVAVASPSITPPPSPASLPSTPIAHLAARQPVTVTLIHMLDANLGWGMGQSASDPNDHVLFTTDGGATWQDVTPPEPADPNAPLGKGALTFALDADNIWVTYYDRTAAPASGPAFVWRSADAGKTWTISQPVDVTGGDYYSPSDLVFVDADTGWLLSHAGAGLSHDYVMLFATADGGLGWERVVDPFTDNLPQSCGKNGMTFADAQTGWVAGDCAGVVPGAPYLQKTEDGGRTWQFVELPPPAERPDLFSRDDIGCGAYALGFFTAQSGHVSVKCLLFTADPVQVLYFLYTTADGGQTWRSSPAPADSVTFLTPDVGWALAPTDPNDPAAPRDLYRTRDGGQMWAKIKSLNWDGQLDFIAEERGWAVARAGEAVALLTTADGGQTWQEIKPVVAP